jgi:hypothetical protein
MASKGTEFTSEAKSEVNAQVGSQSKCAVDPRGDRSQSGKRTQRSAYQS